MISLVGIGNTGCQIINMLSGYDQYGIFEIDEGINIKKQKNAEEYEKKCPSFKKSFSSFSQKVYVFLNCSGNISGISLRVLQQLKNKDLNVICISTDPSLLSTAGKMHQNVVQGVLQEYARSGLLQKLYLIDNQYIESLIGEVSLSEYYQKINEIIAYTFHTMMFFENAKPILSSKEEKSDISRISTFGILDSEKNKKLFYDIKEVRFEKYYYSKSKDELDKNKKILQEIKEDLVEEENISKSFSIFESETQDQNTYIELSTHIVQNFV